jgi:hypothetical protein
MTTGSTLLAASELPRASDWGLTWYPAAGSLCEYPVSWEDHERDCEWGTAMMRQAGVHDGTVVCLVSSGQHAAWTVPFAEGVRRLGGTVAFCDAWVWDANRLRTFLDRLPVHTVVGLNAIIAKALDETVGLAAALSGVAHVLPRQDALGLIDGAGDLAVGCFEMIGPAPAIRLPGDAGLRYDTAEWSLTDGRGTLAITTRGPRAHQVADVDLGIEGRVGDDGLVRFGS